MQTSSEVAVIGGGPVGLVLACLLAQRGVDVVVLEREEVARRHSRAIGIHPPGLRVLSRIGLAQPLIACGIPVRRGHAFGVDGSLGIVSFDVLSGPFGFVLCVPQPDTEAVIAGRLDTLAPNALRRGHELLSLQELPHGVRLRVRAADGEHTIHAAYVVGCDGKHSRVRTALGIGYPGGTYRDRFLMADLSDDTPFGPDAAIFLSPSGLVESFPLPRRLRRWVVATGTERVEPAASAICAMIEQRTGYSPDPRSTCMLSSFAAEHYCAERLATGRVALAGDAAHIVSPIGGQGMNLGWLDALALCDSLVNALRNPEQKDELLQLYDQRRRRAAKAAIRRAELFMAIGRARTLRATRDAFVRSLLSPRLSPHAAGLFTMRGLES